MSGPLQGTRVGVSRARRALGGTTLSRLVALLVALFVPALAAAQGMAGMEHDAAMRADDGAMAMPAMAPGSMQGGAPPPNARDPHAYADGYTLASGPYDLPGMGRPRFADEHSFAYLLFDRLEAVDAADGTATAYNLLGWYGRDYNRVVLKAEGDYLDGDFEETRSELLWGHAVAAYWDAQLGLRHDGGAGADRTWLAFGMQGLAPYWFEMDVTAYVGDEQRSALKLEAEYELLFTQRLVLQPRVEANLYGKDDSARGIGAGLADVNAGLRLRYEIRREFAPYVGVEWSGSFGATADYLRAAGQDTRDSRALAGLRFWF